MIYVILEQIIKDGIGHEQVNTNISNLDSRLRGNDNLCENLDASPPVRPACIEEFFFN